MTLDEALIVIRREYRLTSAENAYLFVKGIIYVLEEDRFSQISQVDCRELKRENTELFEKYSEK